MAAFARGGPGNLNYGQVNAIGGLNIAVQACNYEIGDLRGTYVGIASVAVANGLNYVYLTTAGALVINLIGWPTANHIRLATVTAAAGNVTAIADQREFVSSSYPSTTVAAETFGTLGTPGTSDLFSRGDHVHPMPANPLTPVTGINRVYADGTAGNDANNGSTWLLAVKTYGRAEALVRDLLVTEPTDAQIILYVRGAFTLGGNPDSLTINMPAAARSRVHVVHPVFESVGGPAVWTLIVSGNVVATADPGYAHGNVQLELSDITGVLVGQFIRLRDVTQTKDILYQILRVWEDTGQYYVIISCLGGTVNLPSWVDATATYEVYYPSMTCSNVVFQGSKGPSGWDAAFAVACNPKNIVFGLVATDMLVATGHDVAVAACIAPQTLHFKSVTGGAACWWCQPSDDGPWVSPALMEEFGLGNWYSFIGAEDPLQFVGNHCGDLRIGCNTEILQVASFRNVFAGGVFTHAYCESGSCEIRSSRYQQLLTSGCGSLWSSSSLAGNSAVTTSTFEATGRSTMSISGITYDVPIGDAQCAWIVRSAGARVTVVGNTLDYYPIAGNNQLANGGFFAESGGVVSVTGGTGATLPVSDRLALAYPGSLVEFLTGAITIPAYANAAATADLYALGGIVTLAGDLSKTATNPSVAGLAQPFVHTSLGGKVLQLSGSCTLPAGSGNWLTDYGTTGAIYVHDDGMASVGALSGGAAGTTNVGCYVKRCGKLIYASGGLSGVAPVVVGALAAQPWVANLSVSDPTEAASLLVAATP